MFNRRSREPTKGLARQLVAVFRRVGFQPVNEKTGWKPILRPALPLATQMFNRRSRCPRQNTSP